MGRSYIFIPVNEKYSMEGMKELFQWRNKVGGQWLLFSSKMGKMFIFPSMCNENFKEQIQFVLSRNAHSSCEEKDN